MASACAREVPGSDAFGCDGDVCSVSDVVQGADQDASNRALDGGLVETDVPCQGVQDCTDGNPCTIDACGPNELCTHSPVSCTDGTPCTVDGCDGSSGTCYHHDAAEGASCDDGDLCTAHDSCHDGACVAATDLDCSDGNPCTADSCSEGTCAHVVAHLPCSDGNSCTVDVCVDGVCISAPGDSDSDGYPSALCGGDDCNDGDKQTYPGADERCNGLDDDCDGETDEGLAWSGIALGKSCSVGKGACAAGGTVLCVAGVAVCNAKAGKPGGWSSSPAGNGSWDWDCDGKVSKRYEFSSEGLAKPSGWCDSIDSPKGGDWTCHVTTRGTNGSCAEVFIANCGSGDGCGETILKAECKPEGPYNCNAAGVVGLIKQECR